MRKVKLILAIRSLDIGGAERQFIELVKHIDKSKFDILVCTMYGGVQENEVKAIPNIKYINLEKKGRYDFFKFYWKYKSVLEEFDPHVIYSFLGEMNLFSYWCKPKTPKLIWGFRAANMDLSKYGKLSQFLFWLQKKYSKKVDKIIANSHASIEFHKKQGFAMDRAVVVYNGIDIQKFKKDAMKREEFRQKYNMREAQKAIGMVARIDHMKGYPIFTKAAMKILQKYKNVKFFVIGDGDSTIKQACENILGEFNESRFIWLGKQRDVENFYSGFDIYVSSSFGEGFSNTIAEAMACEVPCVVTDVGDSKIIVGECGEVAQPRNVEDLVEKIEMMFDRDLQELGKCSRKRIVENFSLEKMVQKTEDEIRKCVES
ncbi:glycosyltransferase [Nitratiruptor sp. YY09-18]|uniref:glycosyltransferase n=1 Tax=Nitratiruptor sp. YY09-18 TaxID=2724901 RepID=UPI001915C1B1|nr:glycosyltransferase [Nitratiruptor sp. YY09-18]BCD67749.1 glycosyl transferase [Nitratiruptor sp. YY09-18]